MKKNILIKQLVLLLSCMIVAIGLINFFMNNEKNSLKVKRNKEEIKEVQIEKKTEKIIFPNLKDTIKHEGNEEVVKNPDSYLVFINKARKLPDNYEPSDLTTPNVPFVTYNNPEKTKLRTVAATALEQLFIDSEKNSLKLYALSGFRFFQPKRNL